MSGPGFLSQAEIDALVTKATGRPRRPRPDRPALPPIPAPLAAAVPVPRESEPLEPPSAESAMVMRRLARLESAIAEARRDAAGRGAQTIDGLAADVAHLAQQVEYLLQRPWAYRLRETFTCRSCAATQYVAERIKCTQCGEETWWGWFPKPDSL